MAKSNWGITSGFIGKLGNVVGFNWKGTNVQRSNPVSASKSRTKEQTLHRSRFALITHAGGDLYDAIYAGFRNEARNRRTTQNGLFVKVNLENVIGDDPTLLVLDYEHLQLSYGKLLGVAFGEAEVNGNVLSVSIAEANLDDRRVSEGDHVYLVAYCPELHNAKCMPVATRDEEGVLSLTMPAKWAGKRIYAYAFVIGGASYNRGMASMTEYLGAFGAEAPAKTDNEGGEQNNGGTNTGDNGGSQSGTQTGGNAGGSETTDVVAAPVINGTSPFEVSTEVSISGPAGAEIHYTTDGYMPSASSPLYTEPFTITGSTNVRAIAIKDGVSSQAVSRMFSKSSGGDGEPVDTE